MTGPPVWVYTAVCPENSRQAAARCLGHYAAAHGLPFCGKLAIGPGGKPETADGRLHFSVSHSGPVWACAVHTAPVGLDIERRRPGRPQAAIARRFFSSDERALLAVRPGAFYALWCAKEAWVKYTGAGVARGFTRCSMVRGGRIVRRKGRARLVWLDVAAGYTACLWHTGRACQKPEVF